MSLMSETNGHKTNNADRQLNYVKVGDVCEVVRGGSPRPAGDPRYYDGDIPFLKVADLTRNGGIYLNSYQYSIKEAGLKKTRKISPNTLLLSNSGATLGVPKICMIEATINDGIAAFLNLDPRSNLFLYYFWLSKTRELRNINMGAAQPNLNTDLIKNYEIPRYSFEEQQQIVSKIEELFSELDKSIEQLKTAQQQLKVYRQSVLKWAFEGKLTNENMEDGDLPGDWRMTKLFEVITKVFDGPFGSHLKSDDYVDDGVRVIRLENIGHLQFFDDYKTYVTNDKYSTIAKHTVYKGDIIFSSFIADNIRVTILPENIEKAINKADCFCIRISESVINRKYLVYYLSTREVYKQLEDEVHGATRPRINTTQLKNVLIPLCSIDEQKEIVEEIESRLSVADKLEETITNSLQQAETLRQSILKKAFEGKLISA
jgi:type I restriction enzyme S subunit